MILGETGTGKELIARSLHDKSRRTDRAFIPVNCGALPENLVESELFGHRKGAFTGADSHRKGLFEVANGGTLFLDEVGELDKSVQVKLLRFLESGEIRRVGENEPFRVDVRVLCATNRDLREMVANELFREDLFFRLNTFEIFLPPLRERKGDIAALAQHMLATLRLAAWAESVDDRARLVRSSGESRLAGEYPRACQHDRTRDDPRGRRTDPSRAPADPASGSRQSPADLGFDDQRSPLPGPRGNTHSSRCRDALHPGRSSTSTTATSRPLPGSWASASRPSITRSTSSSTTK